MLRSSCNSEIIDAERKSVPEKPDSASRRRFSAARQTGFLAAGGGKHTSGQTTAERPFLPALFKLPRLLESRLHLGSNRIHFETQKKD